MLEAELPLPQRSLRTQGILSIATGPAWLAILVAGCGAESPGSDAATGHHGPNSLQSVAGGASPVQASFIPIPPGSSAGSNVLLVTLDTVRADHLGCYGYAAAQTPHLDALARDGLRFSNAFTTAPSTLPAHASLLTGLYPYGHGARANGSYRAGESVSTLAELLKPAGYTSGAFIAAYVLDARFGLNQGFDHYDDDLSQGAVQAVHGFRERPAGPLVDAALAWIEANQDSWPFFAWVHLFDAHAPYAPPEPFATRFRAAPYDGEIAYVDSEVGRLLAGVRSLEGGERTIVVVTADHGESLGEHGELQHSLFLYDATMHTPLILSVPGAGARGRVLDRQVSHVDIAPTVLDLLGLMQGRQPTWHGVSLLAPEPEGTRHIYMETLAPLVQHGWSALHAVRSLEHKYIQAPRAELYGLVADRGELNNILSREPQLTQELRRELSRHLERDIDSDGSERERMVLDADAARQLAAMGYVNSLAAGHAETDPAHRPDPKDRVPLFERAQRASALVQVGRTEEGLREFEACLASAPDDPWMLQVAAAACREQGLLDRALEYAQHALRLDPENAFDHLQVAQVQLARGEFTLAEEHALRCLELDPESGQALNLLGSAAAAQGHIESAVLHFRRAIEVAPDVAGADAFVALGILSAQEEQHAAAESAFRSALRFDAGNGAAHAGLARSLLAQGEEEGALPALRAALLVRPEDVDLLELLATLLRNRRDLEGAAELLERAVELDPRALTCLRKLARVSSSLGRGARAAEVCLQILAIDPAHVQSLVTLGTQDAQAGRMDQALSYLRKAVEAAPGEAAILVQLGSVEAQAGESREALAHLELAMKLNPALEPQLTPLLQRLRSELESAETAPD